MKVFVAGQLIQLCWGKYTTEDVGRILWAWNCNNCCCKLV